MRCWTDPQGKRQRLLCPFRQDWWCGTAADIERIEAIFITAEGEAYFDVNRAWQPATAIAVLNAVTSRDWIEQPCETLDQCAHVATRVNNPIMLDEYASCVYLTGSAVPAKALRSNRTVLVA